MEQKNEDMENPVASAYGHDAPQKSSICLVNQEFSKSVTQRKGNSSTREKNQYRQIQDRKTYSKPQKETWLPNTRVTNKQKFEQVVTAQKSQQM